MFEVIKISKEQNKIVATLLSGDSIICKGYGSNRTEAVIKAIETFSEIVNKFQTKLISILEDLTKVQSLIPNNSELTAIIDRVEKLSKVESKQQNHY